jgi:hypothetical protein
VRTRSLPVVVALGLLIVVVIGVGGSPVFRGVRWLPWLNLPRGALPSGSSKAPQPTGQFTQGPSPSAPLGVNLALVGVVVLIVVLIAIILVRRAVRRRRRFAQEAVAAAIVDIPATAAPVPDAPVLRRGFDFALHVLEVEREPRDAIIKAWVGLQDAAEDSGIHRGPAETPTEFTSRILGRVAADEEAITTLLRLYLGVRFGDHPVTESDLARARASLESLAASWRDDETATAQKPGGRR